MISLRNRHPSTVKKGSSTNSPVATRYTGSPRGAALITAMLITLVLSGLGLIALHSVNESAWKSANYRSRQQASQVSDSLAAMAVYRMGESGNSYIESMDRALELELTASLALSAEDESDIHKRRTSLIQRGPYRIFAKNPDEDTDLPQELSTNYLFNITDSESNTFVGGLFFNAQDSENSFETNDTNVNVDYSFIVRDPLDGPPAAGFDRSHCFKKVTIASHGLIAPNQPAGESGPTWVGRTNVAMNRNMVETMIGPIPCGSR